MDLRSLLKLTLLLSIFSCSSGGSPKTIVRVPQAPAERAISEAHAQHAMISTQGRTATLAAREALLAGGNAVDAAIAASFAISVERPHSTGLGGGGFFLYREARTSRTYAIDFRERAPLAATRDMYLDSKGHVIPRASVDGARAVATPGFLRGMLEIHRRFATLPLKLLLQPAIHLAEDGLEVYPNLVQALHDRARVLAQFSDSKATFLHLDGTPYRLGETLIQKELANTLKSIADAKDPALAIQRIEREIVQESKKHQGILSRRDFERYQVRWREPLIGTYKGYQIISMPPPSSGGTHVLQILNILEGISLKSLGFLSAPALHQTASAMQLAFADRAEFMGDPDFTSIPLQQLLSKEYATRQRARIHSDHHTPSDQVRPGNPTSTESSSTTHFSIMDEQGNVVSSTQTINDYFGSGVTVPGLGIVLNNEMDDFSAKAGAPNIFGAVGGDANAIAPGKTPLSSMSPTIVMRGNQPIMAVGAPGGTRIITCVAQTLLNYLEYQRTLYDSVSAIRIHDQWRPDELRIDSPGPGSEVMKQLESMGYKIKLGADMVPCRVMAVAHEIDGFIGVADPVDRGSSAGI